MGERKSRMRVGVHRHGWMPNENFGLARQWRRSHEECCRPDHSSGERHFLQYNVALMEGLVRRPVVLLVEDDPLVRLATNAYLESSGYTVIEAGNAADAIIKIVEEQLDIIFTDVHMPGEMDGYGLAQWVETNYPNLPVLVTSGVEPDRSYGLGPLIRKPYDLDAVLQRLADALTARKKRPLP